MTLDDHKRLLTNDRYEARKTRRLANCRHTCDHTRRIVHGQNGLFPVKISMMFLLNATLLQNNVLGRGDLTLGQTTFDALKLAAVECQN
jgi:hypothetical protein